MVSQDARHQAAGREAPAIGGGEVQCAAAVDGDSARKRGTDLRMPRLTSLRIFFTSGVGGGERSTVPSASRLFPLRRQSHAFTR